MLVPVFGHVVGALRQLLDQSAGIIGPVTRHCMGAGLLVARLHHGEIRVGIYFCRIGKIWIRM